MKWIGVVAFLFLSSCTHSVHMYHVSDKHKPLKKGQLIKIEAKQRVFMGFVFDTNYVDTAYAELQNKCSGEITNIHSRYSTSHSFLSWVNKVNIQALCTR